MKRAKIMLMSIAVFATVGSALAFKVAKKGSSRYCYLETAMAPGAQAGACPNQIVDALAKPGGIVNYFYTTLTATDCAHQANCIKAAFNFED